MCICVRRVLGCTPCLAVVLVGERKDSQTYVRHKKKLCAAVGIKSIGVDLPDTATQVRPFEQLDRLLKSTQMVGCTDRSFSLFFPSSFFQNEILKEVKTLNADPSVHGILVQVKPPPSAGDPSLLVLNVASLHKHALYSKYPFLCTPVVAFLSMPPVPRRSLLCL